MVMVRLLPGVRLFVHMRVGEGRDSSENILTSIRAPTLASYENECYCTSALGMIVNRLKLTFLTKRGAFLCWNGWILGSVKNLEDGVRGLMGRDWRGRGVYWQIIGEILAVVG